MAGFQNQRRERHVQDEHLCRVRYRSGWRERRDGDAGGRRSKSEHMLQAKRPTSPERSPSHFESLLNRDRDSSGRMEWTQLDALHSADLSRDFNTRIMHRIEIEFDGLRHQTERLLSCLLFRNPVLQVRHVGAKSRSLRRHDNHKSHRNSLTSMLKARGDLPESSNPPQNMDLWKSPQLST